MSENSTKIDLTPEEASLLIETTLDALYKRVRWSVGHEGAWRSLKIGDVQTYLSALSTLHMKGWMILRDIDSDIIPEFEKAFMIPDNVWDLIDEITSAADWEQVPQHLHSPTLCRVCRVINQEISNATD